MNILVVAAHSDDEVLGCGGTIARHVAEGDSVKVVYMADGVGSRDGEGQDAFEKREAASHQAQQLLGIEEAFSLGFPDNKMDTVAMLDLVKPLEKIVNQTGTEVIYTHHHGDLNIDHRCTCQAVLTACRPQPGNPVRAIYAFEVVSSSEWSIPGTDNSFSPGRFVDISAYLALKLEALRSYDEEMRAYPHARSYEVVEALASLRGGSAGMQAAEAFEVLRERIM